MASDAQDYDRLIRQAQVGRRLFLGITALAAASGPAASYLAGEWGLWSVAGGLALAAVALAVGLPIFNREIRRLRRLRGGRTAEQAGV